MEMRHGSCHHQCDAEGNPEQVSLHETLTSEFLFASPFPNGRVIVVPICVKQFSSS